jgi:DNA-binding beta-propeller fold protein YncE
MRLPALLLAATALAGATAQAAPGYKLAATIPLAGETRCDYLTFDPGTGRVFIAQGSQVTAVDAKTLAVAGHVEGLLGAHGVVVVPRGHGYAASGKDGTVHVFDPATLKTLAVIKVQKDADALAYDTVSHAVYAISRDAGAISVIDTRSDRLTATIGTGAEMEFAGADGHGALLVNAVATGALLRIDTAAKRLTERWGMPGCDAPHGLAVDIAQNHVFVSCANDRMTVLDTTTGQIIATPAIGHGSDAAAIDPARGVAFSSNGDGTLSVIDTTSLAALPSLTTVPGARTMAVDPVSGAVFLVTAKRTGHDAAGPGGERRPSYEPGSTVLLIFKPTS